jgi:1-deoxy-D-xylulose-5-phosphate synthase
MLVAALEAAKKVDDGPVIVHALTTKGKGFPNPEKNYYAYHATGPFDPDTGFHTNQLRSHRRHTRRYSAKRCAS